MLWVFELEAYFDKNHLESLIMSYFSLRDSNFVRLLAKNLKKDHWWWENHKWWERDYEGEVLSLKRKNAVKI